MPVAKDRMDGNERFRSILTNGNPKVLGTLLSELGEADAKRIIDECYRDENDTALIHCVRKAGDGKNKKDKELVDCCHLLLKHGASLSEFDDAGKTALHWACENRNENLVRTLLTSQADPWVKDTKGRNCLHLAVLAGSVECVQAMLEDSPDIKKNIKDTDKEGLSPIVAAVQKGNADILSALVASGAEVNVQEANTKRTPLHYALYIKRRDLFEYLLENGASITLTDHRGTNILHRCCAVGESAFLQHVLVKHDKAQVKKALRMEDGEGATPVIVACQNGNVEQLRLLQQAEAPLGAKDKFKRCALHHCVENTNTECAELLLQWAPNLVQVADEEGLTPLHMAVIAGNAPLIKLLLDKGSNLGALDNEKHSVTHWATVCGHTSVLDVLLEAGAKLSTPDKYSAYPIHYASQMAAGRGSGTEGGNSSSGSEGGSIQILKTLLKHNVSTEVEDKDQRTPIIWAASAGNAEGCRVLKEHGANVNRADKDDLTALHCAASRGHTECVGSLIRHCKAGIDPVDKNHCTPLFYAVTLGHLETIRTLLEYEADCSHTDTRGRTVAHCATVSGSTEVLDVLKDHGIDLWVKNSKGDQPLHEAAQSGHIDVVQFLLNQGSGDNNQRESKNRNSNNNKNNQEQNKNRSSDDNSSSNNNNNNNNINNSNNDGRTCLHIAALTNNVWLCNVLLEKGANVNAIMSNKGKYYTPYDAALIKGHSEAKDILRHHGGVPGTEVSNHAAATIQTKYKYIKKKEEANKVCEEEEEEDGDEEEKRDDDDTNNDDDVKKEEDTKIKTDDGREKSDKSTKDEAEKEAVIVSSKTVRSDEENSNKRDKSDTKPTDKASVSNSAADKPKPVYVEASTQVHTVSPGVLAGESTEDERSEKENRPRPRSSKKSPDAQSISSRKSDSQKSKSNSENNNKSKQPDNTSQNQKPDSKVKPPPLVIKTAEDRESSDEDDEKLTSERSSRDSATSHGNSSDVESLDSVVHSRNKKSPINDKNKHKRVEKDKTSTTKNNATKSNKTQNDTQSPVRIKNESPSPPTSKQIAKESIKQTKAPVNKSVNKKQSSSDSVPDSSGTRSAESESGTDRKDRSGQSQGLTRDSSSDAWTPRPSGEPDRKIDSSRKTEKPSAVPDDNKDMGGLFSKRKVAAMSNKDKSSSHRENGKSPRQENGEVPKRINDGYTDYEDSEVEGDKKEMETPRRKRTRPNKLLSRIQESVRRYEEERRAIRRLHQIKRSQIYSAPMYDVSLFKAIMDNSQQTSQGTPSSQASNWDEYLQEQIRIIAEDRKAARKNASGRDQSCDNSTPSGPNPKSPGTARKGGHRDDRDQHQHQHQQGGDPRDTRGAAAGAGRTAPAPLSRSQTQGVDAPMTRPRAGTSPYKDPQGVGGARQGRSERAQTAHVSRAQASRSGTRKDDPLQLKHEEQQRLLRQAYRPFGTLGGLSNQQRPMTSLNARPMTAGNAKAMSTTSSKTGSTCGSLAGVRQQRSKAFTVMTPYGSRKLRGPMENHTRTGDPSSRKRHPLIFQDPDQYDKRKNKSNTRTDVVQEEDENR